MQPGTATTELVLPGLEGPDSVTQPVVGHWIERGPQKRLMVFSGRSHTDLAQQIAEQLGVELGEVTTETFANGETYVRYDESIRGADVFILQTGCSPIDKHLMELLFMIQAAKLGSAKRITAVMRLAEASFAAWIMKSNSMTLRSTGSHAVWTRKTSAPRIDSSYRQWVSPFGKVLSSISPSPTPSCSAMRCARS